MAVGVGRRLPLGKTRESQASGQGGSPGPSWARRQVRPQWLPFPWGRPVSAIQAEGRGLGQGPWTRRGELWRVSPSPHFAISEEDCWPQTSFAHEKLPPRVPALATEQGHERDRPFPHLAETARAAH